KVCKIPRLKRKMSFRDHVKTFGGIGAVCFAFGLVGGASSQQPAAPPEPPDVQTLGPQVGSRAPDFTLRDQQGQSRTLASLIGPNGLMLVFARSADWCPYCKTQLAELQGRSAQLKRDGIGVAAITYDLRPVQGIHIYAPGITDYQPIVLSLAPQPGLVTGRALYPPPEDHGFAALNEHIPVYNRPFRIVQDVLVDPSSQGNAALKDVTA